MKGPAARKMRLCAIPNFLLNVPALNWEDLTGCDFPVIKKFMPGGRGSLSLPGDYRLNGYGDADRRYILMDLIEGGNQVMAL